MEEEQGKHFCQCGCDREIIIARHHHSCGIPKYLLGHGRKEKKTTCTNEWVKGEQGKHFCACGCGEEIKITTHHRSRGIPKYVNGHSNRGKKFPRKFSRRNDWMEDEQGKHFCHCGCGGEIVIKKYHHSWGIPKYISGHNNGCDNTFGEKHPMFGKHPSEETNEKRRQSLKGHLVSEKTKQKIGASNKGKKRSEEEKRRQSERQKGAKNCNYGKHQSRKWRENISKGLKRFFKENPEAVEKSRKNREHQTFKNHHTKPELIFEEICKMNDIDFHYVGDGSLWIGKTKKLNPDFIEANGKKILVEIFGDYWHSPLLNLKMREDATLAFRKKHYKKYGWKSYFIWETDLLRPDAEQFVLNTLAEVCNIKK